MDDDSESELSTITSKTRHQELYDFRHFPRVPRHIILKKGSGGLGFNIIGGEDGEGIFVSFILAGGSADVSRQLKRGDQLLSVNGIDISLASHEQAAAILKHSGDPVEIIAQYRPKEYNEFETKVYERRIKMSGPQMGSLQTTQMVTMYVRALFDYDPSKDAGLPSRGLAFKKGDILHVLNASDDDWWQARVVFPPTINRAVGIIPSKHHVERKEKTRLKMVKFIGRPEGHPGDDDDSKRKKNSLLRKLSFKRSKQSSTEDVNGNNRSHLNVVPEQNASYEIVEQRELDHVRPVILLGHLKDKLNDDLTSDPSGKFGSCVPHTSRPKKDSEVDGADYHFVLSREQMEQDIANHLFIEAGQYHGNLYGTSLESVRELADSGRHCVLDVSANAIKRLQSAELFPISIFIRPKTVQQLQEVDKKLTPAQATQEFEKLLKQEAEFGESFTAVVEGDTPEAIYKMVREVIDQHSGSRTWVPVQENR